MLTKRDISTPAALLDLDAFEVNLERMAARVKQSGKALRPHFKAHKCVEIARRQIAAGACVVCVATVPEAELLASAGITGLLLTSPLADPRKIARAAQTGAMVVVDHVKQAEWYAEAAEQLGRTVEVLIDLDVGDHRTGARSTQHAIEIAEAVARSSSLRLRGLQAYSVLGSHAGGREHRERVSMEAFQIAAATRDAMAARGFSTEILSGGSTGSWDIDWALPEPTELQAGSYVLMDLAYRREGLDFRHALTILATVVSANHAGFVTVDAGYKAFATDRGYGPEALKLPGSNYRWGGDEFGFLDTMEMDTTETQPVQPVLGDRIEFIPPHCDPTMNLYDTLYACRGEQVKSVWPVKRVR
ncbi:MAG TPA: alanine racemase [Bryobacteraceae bacterium]|nr:alanine racemase [Bryobacteraceae bacterium]